LKTLIITFKKKIIQPSENAIKDAAFEPGFKISNSKPDSEVSACPGFVK
jgi:hypothetical protein